MTYEEYYQMLNQIMQDKTLRMEFLISAFVMFVICILVCFFIAKKAGISKKYAFFGLLGMAGILIVLCRVMAKSAGISPYFMWLGLFGFYGAALMFGIWFFKTSARASGNYGAQQDTEQKEDNWSSEWQRRYDEGRRAREEMQNGTGFEEKQQGEDRGCICLNCGAAVAAGVKICPRCGEKVKK
jgi:hypothetical protein